ncbi:uncharacterized protein LOC109446466 isoform X3 [Rhinolophus sinicus]|uniref:uncharacterized protein LOC109446466 isoform X3 n=1 Tax=Rhinolophus sinicus TaxID=89399 RepID=UPI003D7BEB75
MGKKPKPSGPPPPRPSARPIPGSPGAKLDAPRPTQRPEPGDSPAPAPRLELEPRDGDLGKFFSGGGAKLPARRSAFFPGYCHHCSLLMTTMEHHIT